MHIATAIRYGYQGLVTTDHDVLKATAAIATEFGGFRLMLPSQAVAWVTREVAHRKRVKEARAKQMKFLG
jgi:histidinol phosphatase-like PHP family hydrolase